jgi:hypothetical protein
VVDSDFAKVDAMLLEYADVFSRAIGQDLTQSLREQALALAQDSALWQQALTDEPGEHSSLPTGLMTEHPLLYLLNSVSEVLLNQLLPVPLLRDEQDEFFRTFHQWLIRYWLAQFGRQQYSAEFQAVVEFLIRILRPFDQHAGRTFNRVLEDFVECFAARVKEPLDLQHFSPLQQQLSESYQSFQQKIRVFEQRVIQFETQLAQNATVQQQAQTLVHQTAEGGEVPDWVYSFICEHWVRLFHLTLLKQGADSPLLEQGQTVLKELIKALTLRTCEDVQQGFATIISPLRNRIRELFGTLVMDEVALDTFLDRLEAFHIAILQGEDVDTHWLTFAPMTKPPVEDSDIDNKPIIAQLKVGSWFNYRLEDRSYCCRVIERNMNLKLIVLANYSGARVAALSFSEAAKALANGELVPLLLQSDLAEKVAELSRFLRTQISSITQQLEIKQKAARRRQLLARLEQSRRERLEIKKARREAEKRARQLEQQRLRQRQIRELEQSLQNLGAGSSFVHHERQDLIMQFALRLKHSGKLVFVDKKGVRVGEWLPQELAELMVDGKVELLASRQSNEQTLEQIVAQQRSRRKDMGVNV